MNNPEPRAQYLNVVLRQIERSALRIPQFQRDFVWVQRDVLDLLESIRNGYPIGSILTWRIDSERNYFSGFRTDPFPEPDPDLAAYEVVLDGAQRLSTLYGCLRSASSEGIYAVVYDLRTEVFLASPELARQEPWHIPMSALFDSRRFLEIQGKIAGLADSDVLLHRAVSLFSTFQEYQLAIVALASDALEEVVEVFRRINSTGTPLSPVDFVRALTWTSKFDLEETFDDLELRYEGTPLEEISDDFLIKCLAVTVGLSTDARNMLRLKSFADRQGALDSEVADMRKALDRMAEFLIRLGIQRSTEIPYEVQAIVLFALMHFDAAVTHDEIETWFWESTFAEEHQGKPESYVSRLVRLIRDGDPLPALAVRRPVDPELFAHRVRRAGTAIATGFDLLLRVSGARSLLTGAGVSGGGGVHGLLYPRAVLEEATGVTYSSGPLLGNLVLLTAEDAVAWRGLTLSEAYAECERRTGDAAAIWESQGLCAPKDDQPVTEVLSERSRRLLSRVGLPR
jgi:hypothetical protein